MRSGAAIADLRELARTTNYSKAGGEPLGARRNSATESAGANARRTLPSWAIPTRTSPVLVRGGTTKRSRPCAMHRQCSWSCPTAVPPRWQNAGERTSSQIGSGKARNRLAGVDRLAVLGANPVCNKRHVGKGEHLREHEQATDRRTRPSPRLHGSCSQGKRGPKHEPVLTLQKSEVKAGRPDHCLADPEGFLEERGWRAKVVARILALIGAGVCALARLLPIEVGQDVVSSSSDWVARSSASAAVSS
jgi:hypothetical protein